MTNMEDSIELNEELELDWEEESEEDIKKRQKFIEECKENCFFCSIAQNILCKEGERGLDSYMFYDKDLNSQVLKTPMVSEENVKKAEERMFDIIWYNRSKSSESKNDDALPQEAIDAHKRIEAKYTEKELYPKSDFEWGMWSGQLAALRWVLGSDWEDLDT